jgi:uncharacterized membrane protein
MSQYMMLGLWALFIVMGNYMGKIRRNYFIWIKLPWTLDNDDVWNKTHRLWWKMFMLAGILFILNSYFNFNSPLIFIFLITVVLFVPMIYSYVIYKKLGISK